MMISRIRRLTGWQEGVSVRKLPRRLHLGVIALTIVLLVLALATRSGRGGAQTPIGDIAFSPASLTIGPNPAPIDLTVANVSDLDGYNVWLTFNSSVRLNGLSDAGALNQPNASGTPQNLVTCLTPTITTTSGHLACQILPLTITMSALGIDPLTALTVAVGATPIPLVRASFSAVSGGTSALSLAGGAGTSVLDMSNVAVNASLGSGSLTAAMMSVGGVAEQPDTAALPQQRNGSDQRMILTGAALPLTVVLGAALTIWMRRRKGAVR